MRSSSHAGRTRSAETASGIHPPGTRGGGLRIYRTMRGQAFLTSTPHTSLGKDWNQYDLLTSPGDVSGDGRSWCGFGAVSRQSAVRPPAETSRSTVVVTGRAG